MLCDFIAPNCGQELFQEMAGSSLPQISDDLVSLMIAHQNASTRNLKLKILSLYAYRYPTDTLIKLHEPYGKITQKMHSVALDVIQI